MPGTSPTSPTPTGSGVSAWARPAFVHGEQPYTGNGESMTSDVAIDGGLDLVLVEVTSKRLTVPSLLDADVEKIRDDLNVMVVDNLRQHGRVILDLAIDKAEIPGIDMRLVRTVWPVIVAPETAVQTPSFWNYIERVGLPHLKMPKPEVPQNVKPPVVLDLEEYERLMGIVLEGHSLVDVLERKTSEPWRHRDFKVLALRRSAPDRERRERVRPAGAPPSLRAVKRELGIRGRPQNSDGEDERERRAA